MSHLIQICCWFVTFNILATGVGMLRTSILTVAVLFVAACGKTSSSDPVDGLKSVMGNLQTKLNNQKPVITPPKPGDPYYTQWWGRKIYTNPTMEFDVQKTDSLVSPYRGLVNFECNNRFAKGDSQESVQGELRDFVETKCRATYAFQEKKWVFKALACNRDPSKPTFFEEIEAGDSSVLGQCRSIASSNSP